MIGEDAEEIDVEQLRKLLWHIKSRKTKKFEAKCDYDTKESLVARVVWHGGSESATFNRLEVFVNCSVLILCTLHVGDCHELIPRYSSPQGGDYKSAGQSVMREKLLDFKVTRINPS